MLKYILKRLFLAIFTIIIALVITFFLLRLVNKEPSAITDEISERQISSPKVSSDEIKNLVFIKYNYHPEWNSFKAFGNYVSGIFHGNFGDYYGDNSRTIPQHFMEPLKYTFIVAGLGFVFGTLIGLVFGIFAGYKRGRWPDIALNFISILFVAIPTFVMAAIIVVVLNKTSWPTTFLPADQAGGTWLMFKTLIIPIGIITITSFATITYYVRNEVVEVLKSDYVATARSKGLSENRIFFNHVLRNISIPAVTIILPRFIFIIMGSLIIELFFNVPGTSKIFSTAIIHYEYNVILFSILFFTSISIIMNIFIDVLYTLLDPRIKLAEKSNFSYIQRIRKYFSRKKVVVEKKEG